MAEGPIKEIKVKKWKKKGFKYDLSKDTVFINKKRSVAGNETQHCARVDEKLDTCFLLGTQPPMPAPFPNEIHSKHLKTGATKQTAILHDPSTPWAGLKGAIWVKHEGGGGLLDAVPSYPVFPTKGFGIVSGTNYGWAEPITSSINVVIEGGGAVRHEDLTWQNNRNATGIVNGPPYEVKHDIIRDKAKQKCTLHSVYGQCAHGRPVGFAPDSKEGKRYTRGESAMPKPGSAEVKNGNYLECAATALEKVTFKAELRDGSMPDKVVKAGQCEDKKHPKWTFTRKGKKSWFGLVAGEKTVTYEAEDEASTGIWLTSVSTPVTEFQMIPVLRRWKEEAPLVTMKVEACTGAHSATMRIMPTERMTLKVTTEGKHVDKWVKEDKYIKENLKHVEWIEKAARKLCSYFGEDGKRGDNELKVLRTGSAAFEAEFIELTKNKNGHSWVECNLWWKMSWGYNPLIGIKYRRNLQNVLPWWLRVGLRFLKYKWGVELGLFFRFELSHALLDVFGEDEYKVLTQGKERSVKAQLSLEIEVKWKKYISISAEAGVEGKASVVYQPSNNARLDATGKDEIQGFFKVSVKFKDGAVGTEVVNKRPKWARFKFEGMVWRLL